MMDAWMDGWKQKINKYAFCDFKAILCISNPTTLNVSYNCEC